jgi:hypothetical protein
MKNLFSKKICGGIAVVALGVAPLAQAQLIQNGGFETSFNQGYNGANQWSTFGDGFSVLNAGPGAYAGVGEAKLYGNFSGGFNVSGIYQDFSAAAGQMFSASGYGQNWAGDAMQAGNAAFIRVTYFDSGNNEIGGGSYGANSASITNATPLNVWTALSVATTTAPTGTAYGQVLLLFTQPANNYNGGSAWFDNVSVSAVKPVPEPMTMLALAGGAAVLLRRRK